MESNTSWVHLSDDSFPGSRQMPQDYRRGDVDAHQKCFGKWQSQSQSVLDFSEDNLRRRHVVKRGMVGACMLILVGTACFVVRWHAGHVAWLRQHRVNKLWGTVMELASSDVIPKEPYDMVEHFFGVAPSPFDKVNVALQMRLSYGDTTGMNPNRVIPLVAQHSSFVKGLQEYVAVENTSHPIATGQLGLTRKSSLWAQIRDPHPELTSIMSIPSKPLEGKPVIVGTVRMGFGHHRIAYSAITWALEKGAQPFLIDILGIDCPESRRVAQIERQYSKFSRISSNMGGLVDEIWTKMLLNGGGLNTLRFSCELAEQLKPMMAGLPKDYPVIAAHPWIGQIAVACGFQTVINLVIDNHPQYFVLVPGALNLVQSPSYYLKLLNMGIPADQLKYAGHWVSRDIAMFAVDDSQARLLRCQKKRPLRLLISIGGAGAQQMYVQGVILGMKPLLKSRRVKLIINSGDHQFMADSLTMLFDVEGIDHAYHRTQESLNKFLVNHQLTADEPPDDPMITIFKFDAHYAAFRATDLLIRVSDVLATKPSELAFFPVPKLNLRHVGGHESDSALRSCELGDGTAECTTVKTALQYLELLAKEQSPMLMQMNHCIMESARAHIYDGSKVAVEVALGAAPSGIGPSASPAKCPMACPAL